VAFNATLSAGMNGGIVGAVIAFNTVYVMVCAYILFKESLTKVKFLCMLFFMSSVVLVVLFPPEYIVNQEDLLIQNAGVGGINTKMSDDSSFIPRLT
jgi:drug/metabolite transporter (DMT)-like permease